MYFAKRIAACFTFSSRRFLITRIFRGFEGQVNLYTFPAGESSSRLGLGGTKSGLRKGNVGGGEPGEGGCWRSVGLVWLGNSIVDLRVAIPLRVFPSFVPVRLHSVIIILSCRTLLCWSWRKQVPLMRRFSELPQWKWQKSLASKLKSKSCHSAVEIINHFKAAHVIKARPYPRGLNLKSQNRAA